MQIDLIRFYGINSLEHTIGEACAICAEAMSTCINERAQGDAYMQILETVYFTVIFLLLSIDELAVFARFPANRHIYMVLRTLACWMDTVVFRCMLQCSEASNWMKRLDFDLLKNHIAFRSLGVLVYVLVRHYRHLFVISVKLIPPVLIGTSTPNICSYRSHTNMPTVYDFRLRARPHFPGGIRRQLYGPRRLPRSKASLRQQIKGLGDS